LLSGVRAPDGETSAQSPKERKKEIAVNVVIAYAHSESRVIKGMIRKRLCYEGKGWDLKSCFLIIF